VLQPNLRRTLASIVLVFAVSLLLAQPAVAAPRSGREGAARSSRVVERWGSLAWSVFAGVWEKISVAINPDGQRERVNTDGPH
jgi:hypothetical protein